MAKRTVLVAVWEYRNAKGKRRLAYFGDTVDLTKEAIELGEAVDAFGVESVEDPDDLDEDPDSDPDKDADADADADADVKRDESDGDDEGSAYTEPVAEPAAPVAASISEPVTPPVVVAAAPERPKNVATKPVWEAYAIERGVEGAKSMSKDELVAAIDAIDAQS